MLNLNTNIIGVSPLAGLGGIRGTIASDDFPGAAFSANWTTFGADLPTVSGGKAVFQNGSGTATWSKGVRYSAYPTNLNKCRISLSGVQFTSARAANTFGIGVGFYSVANRAAARLGMGVYLNLSTGANSGKLIVGNLNPALGFTQVGSVSSGTLAVNTNDVLTYVVTQIDNEVTFVVTNVTTGAPPVSVTATYTLDTGVGTNQFLKNRAQPCIFSLGNGITTVESFEFESLESTSNDYVLCVDSIGAGYSANSVGARLPNQTFSGVLSSRTWANLGGPSNKAEDFLSPQTEHLSYSSGLRGYVWQVGTNNKEHDTLLSYQTATDSFVTGVLAIGKTVVLCNLIPRNDGLDVRDFNDWLVTRYGPGGTFGTQLKIIDFFTAFRDSGTSTDFDANPAYMDDSVHPNAAGFVVMGTTLRNGLIEFEAGDLSL